MTAMMSCAVREIPIVSRVPDELCGEADPCTSMALELVGDEESLTDPAPDTEVIPLSMPRALLKSVRMGSDAESREEASPGASSSEDGASGGATASDAGAAEAVGAAEEGGLGCGASMGPRSGPERRQSRETQKPDGEMMDSSLGKPMVDAGDGFGQSNVRGGGFGSKSASAGRADGGMTLPKRVARMEAVASNSSTPPTSACGDITAVTSAATARPACPNESPARGSIGLEPLTVAAWTELVTADPLESARVSRLTRSVAVAPLCSASEDLVMIAKAPSGEAMIPHRPRVPGVTWEMLYVPRVSPQDAKSAPAEPAPRRRGMRGRSEREEEAREDGEAGASGEDAAYGEGCAPAPVMTVGGCCEIARGAWCGAVAVRPRLDAALARWVRSGAL
jgi:hypothetical protein